MPNLSHWRRQSLAAWKFLASFLKRDWVLEDYPVELWPQPASPLGSPERFRVHPWRATITNWHLCGTGETPEAAIENLKNRFAEAEAGRDTMPRPGTKVPIEFAATDRVSRHSELAEDFVKRVLGHDWAFISDASSLWEFHFKETNTEFEEKIRDVYGVDVSDIESGNLADILDRIAAHGDLRA